MKALCWNGKEKIGVETVPDPAIINPRDAIVRITMTAICGSDLHLYNGRIPTLKAGDILGHEFMGEVVDLGPGVKNLKRGDKVVVPFTISCGGCFFCKRALWSLCDNSNPSAEEASEIFGTTPAALFGYSHLFGGYAGGQAQYARVPFADVGPIKVPHDVPDERVLFLSDILPTGYQAAENAEIEPGDTVAVWGAGPVGQMTALSCRLLGAERVIVIDDRPERLRLAAEHADAETINFEHGDGVLERLLDMTGGRGPDRCIDAVGLEAHGATPDSVYDMIKVKTWMATDQIHVVRQAIRCCRKGGTVSIPGVYGGFADKFPIGVAFNKGLTFRMGQTHMMRYMRPLLDRIMEDGLDPSFIITHRGTLDDGPAFYREFRDRPDECFKCVMRPE